MTRRLGVVGLLLASMALPSTSYAQSGSRLYAGGAFAAFTQTHSDTEPLGGTAWSGSALFGGWVSSRIAVELEPSFGPTFSSEYSYRPSPSLTADVVASRRDSFWAFQVRTRAGAVEPAFGLAYTHASRRRHATIGTQTYFDDGRSDKGIAAVVGLDAPITLAPHVCLFPTFRMLVPLGSPAQAVGFDALGDQTSTGALVLRYGVGARVTF